MARYRPSRSTMLATLGGIAVLTGVCLYHLLADRHLGADAAVSGWFGYAPLSNVVFTPQADVRSAGQNWGTALALLGALLISGVLGYRFGRRPALEPGPAGPA